MQNIKKQTAVITASGLALFASTQSFADSWDFATLTSGISFSGVSTGILAVAGLLAAVYAGVKGARIVLSFLRS